MEGASDAYCLPTIDGYLLQHAVGEQRRRSADRILSDRGRFAFLKQRRLLAADRCSQRIAKKVSAPYRRLYKLAESTNGLQWNDPCDENIPSGWHVVPHVVLRDDTGCDPASEHNNAKLVQDSGQPMEDPVVEKSGQPPASHLLPKRFPGPGFAIPEAVRHCKGDSRAASHSPSCGRNRGGSVHAYDHRRTAFHRHLCALDEATAAQDDDRQSSIVTVRRPRGRFADASDLTPDKLQRRRDAADEPTRCSRNWCDGLLAVSVSDGREDTTMGYQRGPRDQSS